jgi:catechol 2,3-dioxygenase-like lactoylglutathione lyase family enzyme
MTIQRMDHVGIVVDDLAAATAFFVELGLKLQGEGSVEGGWWTAWWVLRASARRSRCRRPLMATDGSSCRSSRPVGPGRRPARAGEHSGHPPCHIRSRRYRRRRRQRASARRELVGEVENYQDIYRLCYVRGPEGIIVELAEQIG